MKIKHQRVLITGVSSLASLSLAREFARNGHPLFLVGTAPEELEKQAENIRQECGVAVIAAVCDFREPAQVDALLSDLSNHDLAVEIMCNHFAEGRSGKMWELPESDVLGAMRTNVAALLRLTRALLPAMVQRGHGRILNVLPAEISAPGQRPASAVDQASKAFVISLSESLAIELQDTAITVTAFCPSTVSPKSPQTASVMRRLEALAAESAAAAAYKALMDGVRLFAPKADSLPAEVASAPV